VIVGQNLILYGTVPKKITRQLLIELWCKHEIFNFSNYEDDIAD